MLGCADLKRKGVANALKGKSGGKLRIIPWIQCLTLKPPPPLDAAEKDRLPPSQSSVSVFLSFKRLPAVQTDLCIADATSDVTQKGSGARYSKMHSFNPKYEDAPLSLYPNPKLPTTIVNTRHGRIIFLRRSLPLSVGISSLTNQTRCAVAAAQKVRRSGGVGAATEAMELVLRGTAATCATEGSTVGRRQATPSAKLSYKVNGSGNEGEVGRDTFSSSERKSRQRDDVAAGFNFGGEDPYSSVDGLQGALESIHTLKDIRILFGGGEPLSSAHKSLNVSEVGCPLVVTASSAAAASCTISNGIADSTTCGGVLSSTPQATGPASIDWSSYAPFLVAPELSYNVPYCEGEDEFDICDLKEGGLVRNVVEDWGDGPRLRPASDVGGRGLKESDRAGPGFLENDPVNCLGQGTAPSHFSFGSHPILWPAISPLSKLAASSDSAGSMSSFRTVLKSSRIEDEDKVGDESRLRSTLSSSSLLSAALQSEGLRGLLGATQRSLPVFLNHHL